MSHHTREKISSSPTFLGTEVRILTFDKFMFIYRLASLIRFEDVKLKIAKFWSCLSQVSLENLAVGRRCTDERGGGIGEWED